MSRVKAFVEWLTQTDSEQEQSVDVEYLSDSDVQYKYMSMGDGLDSKCRCDLCGQQFDLEAFPELVEHVAAHDEQGSAEIDPFEHPEEWGIITKETLNNADQWNPENGFEVEE